jgi:hypothetical protein
MSEVSLVLNIRPKKPLKNKNEIQNKKLSNMKKLQHQKLIIV